MALLAGITQNAMRITGNIAREIRGIVSSLEVDLFSGSARDPAIRISLNRWLR